MPTYHTNISQIYHKADVSEFSSNYIYINNKGSSNGLLDLNSINFVRADWYCHVNKMR